MIFSLTQLVFVSLLFVGLRSQKRPEVGGRTAPGWEFVRPLFEENFLVERDLGASLAMYHQGELVVDLWGGWFDRSYQRVYDNDTLQLVFSTTKGLVAVAAALCVQRGLIDYSALVTKYWPEYGQQGKENTTVADLLSHRAGLPFEMISFDSVTNWTTMVNHLERLEPLWPPGSAHGYHALTYGWLVGEIIRRADPQHRTVGQFIREEIADLLQIEFYIGLPDEEEDRVSPIALSLRDLELTNETTRAVYYAFNQPSFHRAEIPAANGITNGRSVAKLYASLIGDLHEGKQRRLLEPAILERAIRSNTPDGEIDVVLQQPSSFGMGFWLFDETFPLKGFTAFGHGGRSMLYVEISSVSLGAF